jgi:hypothetical protein
MKTNQTFFEFCRDFLGKRIYKRTLWNGIDHKIEVSKSELYWSGISYKSVYLSDKYVLENR